VTASKSVNGSIILGSMIDLEAPDVD